MLSILKVGPKIFQLFGYDILVTENKAMWAMEYCLERKNKRDFISGM